MSACKKCEKIKQLEKRKIRTKTEYTSPPFGGFVPLRIEARVAIQWRQQQQLQQLSHLWYSTVQNILIYKAIIIAPTACFHHCPPPPTENASVSLCLRLCARRGVEAGRRLE